MSDWATYCVWGGGGEWAVVCLCVRLCSVWGGGEWAGCVPVCGGGVSEGGGGGGVGGGVGCVPVCLCAMRVCMHVCVCVCAFTVVLCQLSPAGV